MTPPRRKYATVNVPPDFLIELKLDAMETTVRLGQPTAFALAQMLRSAVRVAKRHRDEYDADLLAASPAAGGSS